MNLGCSQKYREITLKRFISKSIGLFNKGEWAGLGHYLVSETSNLLSDIEILQKNNIFTCPICNFSAKNFIHLSNSLEISWNSACPNCNSRSRHRGLIFLYHEILKNKTKMRILHFAPEPTLEKEIRKYKQHKYFTTDYNIKRVDFPGEDIQKLNFDDSEFDLILVNHVLEHVLDDKKALSEISRVLNKNGVAVITIPGDWRRRHTKILPNLNYNGHYRDYGLDVIDIMKDCFSKVVKSNLFQFHGEKNAIKSMEIAFICLK